LVLSPTGSINLSFILREDLLLCSSYLPLGVPNWVPNKHYHLPDKFVAGCIIAKLPPSWRNFITALKHKIREISVENPIVSLDIEGKARAKDTTKKGECHANANFVQKGKPLGKNKGKFKPSFNKPIKTTTFKKKKPKRDRSDLTCFTCREPGHDTSILHHYFVS
jgi:hypothetical protein